ncbi:unnamed protein product [Moneuplotes crassus]|uniref:RING-type domain-containing protein n=1 Tax=Euplotes crassus TaxID=5936 RepID=A0AAD1X9K8_EUPCR|nr:unnamed protein product [Moneuplotes crassus]
MARLISLIVCLCLLIPCVEDPSWVLPHKLIQKQKSEFETEIDDIISRVFELQLRFNFPSCGELVSQRVSHGIPTVQEVVDRTKIQHISNEVNVHQYKCKNSNIIVLKIDLFHGYLSETTEVRFLIFNLDHFEHLDNDCFLFMPFMTYNKAICKYNFTNPEYLAISGINSKQYLTLDLETGEYSISVLSVMIVCLLECLMFCYYIYFCEISDNRYDFTSIHSQVNNTFMGYLLCYLSYQKFALAIAIELKGWYSSVLMICVTYAIFIAECVYELIPHKLYFSYLDAQSYQFKRENWQIFVKVSALIVTAFTYGASSFYLMKLKTSSEVVVVIMNLHLAVFGGVNAYKKTRIKLSVTYIVFLTFYCAWIINFSFVVSGCLVENSDYIWFFSKIGVIHFAVGTFLYFQGIHGSRFFIPNKFRSIKMLRHIKDLPISQLTEDPLSCFYCCSSLHLPSSVSKGDYLNCNIRSEVKEFVWQQGPVYIEQENCSHKYHFECAREIFDKRIYPCNICHSLHFPNSFEFDD